MSESESSVQNINYKTNHGENILDYKKTTTDTDFHFGMIANPSKVNVDNNSETSESEKHHSDSSPINRPNRNYASSPHRSQHGSPQRSPQRSPRRDERDGAPQTSSPTQQQQQQPLPPPQQQQSSHIPDNYMNEAFNQMTPQEIRMKKIELLRRLSEIKTKGYNLSKEYDFNSSIDEMQYEYDLLKSFAEKRNGIKIYKNILLNVTSAVEFLNDKYDPFEFQLSGWSEHLAYDIDSYDEVLEDLYEKYKGSGRKMPPEIKLLLLIVASASAFHFTKSQSLPISQKQTGSILNSVLNGKKQTSQFMTEQEINLERIRDELKNKAQQQPQQPQQQQPQQQPQQPQQFQQQQQQTPQQFPRQSEPVAANAKPQMQPHLPAPTPTTIRQPENVKDILSRIHNLQSVDMTAKLNNNTDTQEESVTNDRLLSESTLSESSKKKKVKQSARISVI